MIQKHLNLQSINLVFQKIENSTPINPYAKEYWESDEKYKSLTEEQYNNNFALIN